MGSWENAAHILDPAKGIAVHVHTHGRVTLLPDEQVTSRERREVVCHMHCVHGCDKSWQAESVKESLAVFNLDQRIKTNTRHALDIHDVVLLQEPCQKLGEEGQQHGF